MAGELMKTVIYLDIDGVIVPRFPERGSGADLYQTVSLSGGRHVSVWPNAGSVLLSLGHEIVWATSMSWDSSGVVDEIAEAVGLPRSLHQLEWD